MSSSSSSSTVVSIATSVDTVVFALYVSVFIIIITFLVFYSASLVAFVLTYLSNLYLWRTQRAHLQLSSVSLSILGGRLLFRRLRYVTKDYSICIEGGYITFRYWLFTVRDREEKDSRHATRVAVHADGAEIFVYNRCDIYERLQAVLAKREAEAKGVPLAPELERLLNPTTAAVNGGDATTKPPFYLPLEIFIDHGAIVIGNPAVSTLLVGSFQHLTGLYTGVTPRSSLDKLRYDLRLSIEKPEISLVQNFDYGRLVLEPKLQRSNRIFRGAESSHAASTETVQQRLPMHWQGLPRYAMAEITMNLASHLNARQSGQTSADGNPDSSTTSPRTSKDGARGDRVPSASATNTAAEGNVVEPENESTFDGEYARVTTLLSASLLLVKYKIDDPGLWPTPSSTPNVDSSEFILSQSHESSMPTQNTQDGRVNQQRPRTFPNSFRASSASTVTSARESAPTEIAMIALERRSLPPVWRVDLKLHNVTINYGPWADRQRSQLMSFFFPFDYEDLPLKTPGRPGQLRLHEAFQLSVQFEGQSVWRIPFREKSKDIQFGLTPNNKWSSRRFAWLDWRFAAGSTLHYRLPFVYNENGADAQLRMELQGCSLVTSINYALLATTTTTRLCAVMPTPRRWNEPRSWSFDLAFHHPQVFLLRDHATLLQDMVADFSAGPSITQPTKFIPTGYNFTLRFEDDTSAYFCVNEKNIIDQPNDLEENAFYVLSAPRLTIGAVIGPFGLQPAFTNIPFRVEGPDGGQVNLILPTSHTFEEFRLKNGPPIPFMKVRSAVLEGEYVYYPTLAELGLPAHTIPSSVDTLKMVLTVQDGYANAFGIYLHYVIHFRDNYFGDTINFTTLDEFRSSRSKESTVLASTASPSTPLPVYNPFELHFSVLTNNISVLLPIHLYQREECIVLHTRKLRVDIRNLQLFLDMHVQIEPIVIGGEVYFTKDDILLASSNEPSLSIDSEPEEPLHRLSIGIDKDRVLITRFDLHLHMMYGVSPKYLTYRMILEMQIGEVSGSLSYIQLDKLQAWAASFLHQVVNLDNILEADPPEQSTLNSTDELIYLTTDIRIDPVRVTIFIPPSSHPSSRLPPSRTKTTLPGDVTSTALEFSLPKGLRLVSNNLACDDHASCMQAYIEHIQLRLLVQMNSSILSPWFEVASINTGIHLTSLTKKLDLGTLKDRQRAFLRHNDVITKRCVPYYEDQPDGSQPFKTGKNGNNHTRNRRARPSRVLPNLPRNKSEELEVSSELLAPSQRSLSDSNSIRAAMPPEEAPSESHEVNDLVVDVELPATPFLVIKEYIQSPEKTESGSEEYFTASSEVDSSSESLDGDVRPPSKSTQGPEKEKASNSSPPEPTPQQETPKIHLNSDSESISLDWPVIDSYIPFLQSFVVFQRKPFVVDKFYAPPLLLEPTTSQKSFGDFEDNFGYGTFPSADKAPLSVSNDAHTDITICKIAPVLDVFVCPVVLPAALVFLETVFSQPPDAERILDDIEISHLQRISARQPVGIRGSQIALEIPSVQVHLVQLLPSAQTLTPGNDHKFVFACDLELRNLSFVMHTQQPFGPEPSDAAARLFAYVVRMSSSFDQLVLSVRSPSDRPLDRSLLAEPSRELRGDRISTSTIPVLAELVLTRVHLNLRLSSRQPSAESTSASNHPMTALSSLSANLHQVSFIAVEHALGPLALAALGWMQPLTSVVLPLAEHSLSYSRHLQQYLVASLSLVSQNAREQGKTPDPTFLTNPSNIWRLGRRSFQADDGWKLQHHFRHCFRLLNRIELGRMIASLNKYAAKLRNYEPNSNPSMLFHRVVKRMASWRNWDREDLNNCSLLLRLYEFSDEPTEIAGKDSLASVWMQAQHSFTVSMGPWRFGLLTVTKTGLRRLMSKSNLQQYQPFKGQTTQQQEWPKLSAQCGLQLACAVNLAPVTLHGALTTPNVDGGETPASDSTFAPKADNAQLIQPQHTFSVLGSSGGVHVNIEPTLVGLTDMADQAVRLYLDQLQPAKEPQLQHLTLTRKTSRRRSARPHRLSLATSSNSEYDTIPLANDASGPSKSLPAFLKVMSRDFNASSAAPPTISGVQAVANSNQSKSSFSLNISSANLSPRSQVPYQMEFVEDDTDEGQDDIDDEENVLENEKLSPFLSFSNPVSLAYSIVMQIARIDVLATALPLHAQLGFGTVTLALHSGVEMAESSSVEPPLAPLPLSFRTSSMFCKNTTAYLIGYVPLDSAGTNLVDNDVPITVASVHIDPWSLLYTVAVKTPSANGASSSSRATFSGSVKSESLGTTGILRSRNNVEAGSLLVNVGILKVESPSPFVQLLQLWEITQQVFTERFAFPAARSVAASAAASQPPSDNAFHRSSSLWLIQPSATSLPPHKSTDKVVPGTEVIQRLLVRVLVQQVRLSIRPLPSLRLAYDLPSLFGELLTQPPSFIQANFAARVAPQTLSATVDSATLGEGALAAALPAATRLVLETHLRVPVSVSVPAFQFGGSMKRPSPRVGRNGASSTAELRANNGDFSVSVMVASLQVILREDLLYRLLSGQAVLSAEVSALFKGVSRYRRQQKAERRRKRQLGQTQAQPRETTSVYETNSQTLGQKSTSNLTDDTPATFTIRLLVHRLSLYLLGPSSSALLQTDSMRAMYTSVPPTPVDGARWEAVLRALTFALLPPDRVGRDKDWLNEVSSESLRLSSLAYVFIDILLKNEPTGTSPRPASGSSVACLTLSRVYGMIEPGAPRLALSLWVYYTQRIRWAQAMSQFLLERSALVPAAKRVLRRWQGFRTDSSSSTIDAGLKAESSTSTTNLAATSSFLSSRLLVFELKSLGLALSLKPVHEQSGPALKPPALLLSLDSLSASSTERFLTSTAALSNLAVRVVDEFDVNDPTSFDPSRYPPRRNAVCLPFLNGELRMLNTPPPEVRTLIYVESQSAGLQVSLNPDMATYFLDLTNVLLADSERMFQLWAESAENVEGKDLDIPTTPPLSSNKGSKAHSQKGSEKQETNVPPVAVVDVIPLEVFCQFEVEAGYCHLYPLSPLDKSGPRIVESLTNPLNIEPMMANGQNVSLDYKEKVSLPSIRMNVKYSGMLGENDALLLPSGNLSSPMRRTHFDIRVQSSMTVLFPPMRTFIDGVLKRIRVHSRNNPTTSTTRASPKAADQGGDVVDASVGRVRATGSTAISSKRRLLELRSITAMIRIASTRFDLDCNPASKIICSVSLGKTHLLLTRLTSVDVVRALALNNDNIPSTGVAIPPTAEVSIFSSSFSLPDTNLRLRHAFSEGDSDFMRADQRGLSMSIVMGPTSSIVSSIKRPASSAAGASAPFNKSSVILMDVLVDEDAVVVEGQAKELKLFVNLRQISDWTVFQRVWMPRSPIGPQAENEKQADSEDSQADDKPSNNDKNDADDLFSEAIAESKESVFSASVQDPNANSLFPKVLFLGHFRVKEIALSAELGQAIGTISLQTQTGTFSLQRLPPLREVQRAARGRSPLPRVAAATFSTSLIYVSARGRLDGHAQVQALMLQASMGSSKQIESNSNAIVLNRVQLSLQRVFSNLKYNQQRILIVDVEPILFTLHDSWRSRKDEESSKDAVQWDVHVQMEVVFQGMALQLSRDTIPAFVKMANRLTALLNDQDFTMNTQADTNPRLALRMRRLHQQTTTRQQSLRNVLQRPEPVVVLPYRLSVSTDIRGTNLRVTLFKFSLLDLDGVLISMDSIVVELSAFTTIRRLLELGLELPEMDHAVATTALQLLSSPSKGSGSDQPNAAVTQRELTISLGATSLQKGAFTKVPIKFEYSDITEEVANLTRSRPIFALAPSSILNMQSWQMLPNPDVAYAFLTNFDEPVGVSLNVAEYQYVQDLASLYSTQFAKSQKMLHKSDLDANKPDQDAASSASAKIVAPKPDVSVFHPVMPIQLEPQLQALGEATPALDKVLSWLGVDRETIPTSVHNSLTIPLEQTISSMAKALIAFGRNMS